MKATFEAIVFAFAGVAIVGGGHLVAGAAGSWPVAILAGSVTGLLLFVTLALARTGRRMDAQEDRIDDRLDELEDRTVRLERVVATLATGPAPQAGPVAGRDVGPPADASTYH
jgi:membrane protein implicated in regulation of membrane protease activity